MTSSRWLGVLALAIVGVALLAIERDLPQRNPIELYLSTPELARYEQFQIEFDERPIVLGRVRAETSDGALLEAGLAQVETLASTAKAQLVTGRTLGEPAGGSREEPQPRARATLALRAKDYEAFIIALPDDSGATELVGALHRIPEEIPGLQVDLAGVPVTNYQLDYYSAAIGEELFPMVFGVGFLIVLLITRHFGTALLIYSPALISTAVALGVIDVTYGSMDMVSAIVPLLIFVLSLSLSLHVRHASLVAGSTADGLREKARPIALMILTTCVGFGALSLSEIEAIRRFGLLSAGLVVATSAVTVLWGILAGPAVPRGDFRPTDRTLVSGWKRAFLWEPHVTLVVVACALCVGGGALGFSAMPVETDALRYFPASSGIAQRANALQREVIGTPVAEIVARPPATLSARDKLKVLDTLEASITDALPGTIRSISRASLIQGVRRRIDGKAELPESPLAQAALWALIPAPLRSAYENPEAERLTIFAENRTAARQRDDVAIIEEAFARLAPGWSLSIEGLYHHLLLSQHALLELLAVSLSGSLAIIAGLFWLTCRSLRMLAVFLVTNLIPILGAAGIAAALGFSLNIATVMVASVALGLIVDSTLHLVHAWRQGSPRSDEATLLRYYRGTLSPIISSAAVLVPCFLLFGFFEFTPIREFGVTLALTLGLALLFNLYALPVLLHRFNPGRRIPPMQTSSSTASELSNGNATTDPGTHDAVVIGAGTAGLTFAALLARAGRNVLVIEASPGLKRHVCGEYLCPSGVSVANALGWPELLEGCPPVTGMVLVSPSGRAIPCDFPEDGAHGQGASINKKELHRRLLARAEQYGAVVRFGTRVKTFERGGRAWNIELSDGETVRGSLLVGADGRRSMVACTLGLTIEHDAPRVAIRGFVEPAAAPDRRGEMHVVGDGSYVGVNPIGPAEVNVSICLDRDQLRRHGGPQAAFRHYVEQSERLRRNWKWSTLRDVVGVYPVTHRVRRVYDDRVALIGDASGFLDPLTGEGMTVALWTAHTLAEAVAAPLAAGDDKGLARELARYGRVRRSNFRQKLFLSRSFQRVIARRWLCEAIGRWLEKSPRRRRALIGAVGNNYTPIQALLVLLGRNRQSPRSVPPEMDWVTGR